LAYASNKHGLRYYFCIKGALFKWNDYNLRYMVQYLQKAENRDKKHSSAIIIKTLIKAFNMTANGASNSLKSPVKSLSQRIKRCGVKMFLCGAAAGALLLSGIYVGRNDLFPFMNTRSEYMIGIFTGFSPLQMYPVDKINPVMTAGMVTDVKADFVADPFMIREGGKWYMFFEILESTQHKGIIGLAVSEDGLNWSYDRVVLEEPFHLSYPMIFRYNDEILMIPESHEDYSVSIYKAENFPYEWKKHRTVLEGDFVDPTIVRHENNWYLFASDRNDMLHLFWAADIYGDWQRHPKSPIVKKDSEHARPGGRVINYKNKYLIRFTQNCKPSYGWDVRAFIISELTTQTYEEEVFAGNPIMKGSGVTSDWNGLRMHQFDAHQIDENFWIAAADGVGRWREFGIGIFGSKTSKSIGTQLTFRSPYKKRLKQDTGI